MGEAEHELRCSFCGRRKPDEVEHLIAGPNVYICPDCVGECDRAIAGETADHVSRAEPHSPGAEETRCAFCGRARPSQGQDLLAGPKPHICVECVGLCNQVLAAKAEKDASAPV